MTPNIFLLAYFLIFSANLMVFGKQPSSSKNARLALANLDPHHHDGMPTILFGGDNLYYSHLEFAISCVNVLANVQKYNVHFLVADHKPDKEDIYGNLDLDGGRIQLIRVAVDKEYLKREFLDKVPKEQIGSFSDWSVEVETSDKPDFWARFRTYTTLLYEAVIKNAKAKFGGKGDYRGEFHILDWLRRQITSPNPYSLGIAEFGVASSAFGLFEELGIQKFAAISNTPPVPAFYHFLGMSISSNIPEFFSAKPRKIYAKMTNWKLENKNQYEKWIKEVEKIYYGESVENYEKLREEGVKNGISLKKIGPIGDLLRRCQAFFINQMPPPTYNFPALENAPKMVKFIGGIGVKYAANLYGQKLGENKIVGHRKEQIEEKQWKSEEECVVLFVLGTIVNFDGMSKEAIQNMFKAMGEQKQCNFLLRFDQKLANKYAEWKPKNVEIRDFGSLIPQQELLAEKNVRAFITHCGQNSLNEALYAGVPLICIPFFYDQPFISALVENLGVGIWLKHAEFADTFPSALEHFLHADEYLNASKRIARQLQSEPMKPGDYFLHEIGRILTGEQIDEPEKLLEKKSEFVKFID